MFCRYSFFSSEVFSYELDGLIEVFFKERPKSLKDSKFENDEVCLGESDVKEDDIADDNFFADLRISPCKSIDKKFLISEKTGNENEEEKKNNSMMIGEKVIRSINMEEAMDMTGKKRMPQKLQYNLDNLYVLEFLFSYLEKNKIEFLNPTSLGYFSKILNALLNKKFDHVRENHFFQNFFI